MTTRYTEDPILNEVMTLIDSHRTYHKQHIPALVGLVDVLRVKGLIDMTEEDWPKLEELCREALKRIEYSDNLHISVSWV